MNILLKMGRKLFIDLLIIVGCLLVAGGLFLAGLWLEDRYDHYKYKYVGEPTASLANGVISVEKETHALIDRKNGILIDIPILSVKEKNGKIYSVSESHFSVYDCSHKSQTIYCGRNFEKNKKTFSYGVNNMYETELNRAKEIKVLDSYSDFTSDERQGFAELFNDENETSFYQYPYYRGRYSNILYDIENMISVTNAKKYKVENGKLYICTADGFMIVDMDKRYILEFFNNIEEKVSNKKSEKENTYGTNYKILDSFNEFEIEDQKKLKELEGMEALEV